MPEPPLRHASTSRARAHHLPSNDFLFRIMLCSRPKAQRRRRCSVAFHHTPTQTGLCFCCFRCRPGSTNFGEKYEFTRPVLCVVRWAAVRGAGWKRRDTLQPDMIESGRCLSLALPLFWWSPDATPRIDDSSAIVAHSRPTDLALPGMMLPFQSALEYTYTHRGYYRIFNAAGRHQFLAGWPAEAMIEMMRCDHDRQLGVHVRARQDCRRAEFVRRGRGRCRDFEYFIFISF